MVYYTRQRPGKMCFSPGSLIMSLFVGWSPQSETLKKRQKVANTGEFEGTPLHIRLPLYIKKKFCKPEI